jgi:hypothetical protein
MPVTTEELIAFLTKLRQGAVKGVEAAPDGPLHAHRQRVLDLIDKDLRAARWVQTSEAMKAAERGEVTTVGHPRKMLKSLNSRSRRKRP